MLHHTHPTPTSRTHLLSGPTTALTLALPSPALPYTIPALPRRMLFALSALARTQLAHPDTKTLTLPLGSASPAALEYIIYWMKAVLRKPFVLTAANEAEWRVRRRGDWRGNVLVLQAAKALGCVEVERVFRGYLEQAMGEGVVGAAECRVAVERLGAGDRVVRALVRRVRVLRGLGALSYEEGYERLFGELERERPALMVVGEGREVRFPKVRYVPQVVEKVVEGPVDPVSDADDVAENGEAPELTFE